MKSLLITGILISATVATTLLLATGEPVVQKGCETKVHHLQQELVKAHAMDNQYRVNGLEISLSNVQEHCTDAGSLKDLEAKIDDKREDLQEHRQDLDEAVADGRVDKIKKYEAKIEKDTRRLKELDRELSALS